eukprot:jgi/Tetstr1/458286/TSEL_044772.t1
MAASSTAQPPGVVKTLTDDKKRKRLVKKRRGKKLTVAESEAEAEAEAAGSSKRRLQVADVGEDVAVDAGVAAKVSTSSDGVGRLSSELLELCEATFR